MAEDKNTAAQEAANSKKTTKTYTNVNGLFSTGERVYKEWETLELEPEVAQRYVNEGILKEGVHKEPQKPKGGK